MSQTNVKEFCSVSGTFSNDMWDAIEEGMKLAGARAEKVARTSRERVARAEAAEFFRAHGPAWWANDAKIRTLVGR